MSFNPPCSAVTPKKSLNRRTDNLCQVFLATELAECAARPEDGELVETEWLDIAELDGNPRLQVVFERCMGIKGVHGENAGKGASPGRSRS